MPPVRRLAGVVVALCLWLVPAASASALDLPTLQRVLNREAAKLGPAAAGYVVDLTADRELWSDEPDRSLVPASNEKLYTTAAALLRFGPTAKLTTTVQTPSPTEVDADGVVHGDVYLVGAGDPSLGDSGLAALASELEASGVTRISGTVLGDESVFDALRGSADSRFLPDYDLGGWLGGLTWAHGHPAPGGPAKVAATRLQALLKARGIRAGRRATAGRLAQAPATPGTVLASVDSPTMARLAASTNQPSDNFYAETLLKGLGARFGASGSTTSGLAVARAALGELGVSPRMADGSGLSRDDRTTPRQIVTLLRRVQDSPIAEAFEASLSVPGRIGTLRKRMRGTAAAGRCPAKTGTLRGVSAVSGYCHTASGDLIAFSLIENQVYAAGAKRIEDRMVAAIAGYAAP
jgi:D-alanyl-D-alanine carboxypeptidase/D-alanyl-D-alanine-endopeptidase (penicillin-binding protein 4)